VQAKGLPIYNDKVNRLLVTGLCSRQSAHSSCGGVAFFFRPDPELCPEAGDPSVEDGIHLTDSSPMAHVCMTAQAQCLGHRQGSGNRSSDQGTQTPRQATLWSLPYLCVYNSQLSLQRATGMKFLRKCLLELGMVAYVCNHSY
jgi:hypothetical protein